MSAQVNLANKAARVVEYDPSTVDFNAIRKAIDSAGHQVAEPKAADVKAVAEADADAEQVASKQEYRTLRRQVSLHSPAPRECFVDT